MASTVHCSVPLQWLDARAIPVQASLGPRGQACADRLDCYITIKNGQQTAAGISRSTSAASPRPPERRGFRQAVRVHGHQGAIF